MADWRIIDDGAGDAAWNMAADEALFESVSANAAPLVIRLYEWNRPSVSLGRFQSVARTVQNANCQRLNVPLVRRITGGRGILHGHDLTVSIAGISGDTQNTISIYQWLAGGFIAAFELLNISATMGTCSRQRATETRGDCFACISQADVIAAKTGEKLLGAALHRRDNKFLLQASIPLPIMNPSVRADDVFTGACAEPNGILNGINKQDLRQAIRAGFGDTLNLSLVEASFTPLERELAKNLTLSRYSCADWTGNRSSEIDSLCAL